MQDAESPDAALESFQTILPEIEVLLAKDFDSSESGTRANIIDRLIHEVLFWPRCNVRREQHIDGTFADYILTVGRPLVVLEAKRHGRHFAVPVTGRRRLKISGTLWTHKETREALQQAQRYCNDEGIPFGILCNGHQWITFRAIDPNRPWKDGSAILFRSTRDIESCFTEFWNLLSWPAIYQGSLTKSLSVTIAPRASGARPLEDIRNPDERFNRNPLHLQLYPIIQSVFTDIANHKDTLRACYVGERSTQTVVDGLSTTIEDTVPHFARNDEVSQTTEKSLTREFTKIVDGNNKTATTVILMGGVGAGKTTFLRRFFDQEPSGFIRTWCISFTIEFTQAPPEGEIKPHVLDQILQQLRSKYPEFSVDDWETYLRVFSDDIERAKRGTLGQVSREEYASELRKWISGQVSNTELYLSRLFSWIQRFRGKTVIINLDNLDQTGPEYQRKIFQLAHNVSQTFNCIVIVSLREETYFTGGLSGSFDAYHNKRFHIPSPDFSEVIRKRLSYGARLLTLDRLTLKERLNTATEIDQNRVTTFLKIVQESFLSRNPAILRCIRSISRGNTRRGLDMCNQFMVSGYADVAKMLELKRDCGYTIAFHEFVKSWAMGERRFYKESASEAMNLFGLSESDNASHFTSHRILIALMRNRSRDSRIGKGFTPIQELTRSLLELFGDEVDVRSTLDKLLHWELVESDSQQRTSGSSSHIRISNAGEFYLRYLTKSFVYLDLVLLDTPIRDRELVKHIVNTAYDVDLEVRLDRASRFIDYLQAEEDLELAQLEHFERSRWEVTSRIRNRIVDREFQTIRQSAERGQARRKRRTTKG